MSLSPYIRRLNQPYERNRSGCNTFSRSMLDESRHFYQKDLKAHFGCVNALEFSNKGGEYIVSGGDDRRVLLWKYEEALSGLPPQTFKAQHFSNIFCLAFDNEDKRVLSGGNDEQVLVHDVETGKIVDVYRYGEAVYCLSVDPLNSNVFASAADDGEVAIYDMRSSEDPFVLVKSDFAMHAVMYNPMEPRLLVTANSRQGLCLWDVRQPKSCLMRYGGRLCKQSAMSVRFSRDGRRLIALRRRLPPVLYSLHSPAPLAQFDHPGYYNSCAMKTCCFAGDNDQFLLSGSDDNNVYMWKIPEEPIDNAWQGEAHAVLRGHRSLVNQVRYNPYNQCIISSGVEKIIKVWSPLPLPGPAPEPRSSRGMYSHEQYIHLVLRSGELMAQDTSAQTTDEDPRMFAFFDSLVQRELEGWSSEEEDGGDGSGDSVDGEDLLMYTRFVASSVSSENSSDDSDARSEVYSPFTRVFASVIANQEPNNFPSLQALNDAADSDEARDRAARDRTERDRSERDRSARCRVERDRAETDRAERDRSARDSAARDRSETDRAERDRAERDRAERDRAERDRTERDRVTSGETSTHNTRDSPLVNGNRNNAHRESSSSASSDNETMRSRLLADETRPVLRIGVNVPLPDSDSDQSHISPSSHDIPTPAPAPMTVTDLILSKRKEYLAGIHKQEARQRRRRRMQVRRCRERVGLGSNDSSESVNEGVNGGAVLNGSGLGNNGDEDNDNNNSTSSSSDGSEEEEDRMFRLPDRVRNHHRQHKNLERISRLRFLRSQVEGEENPVTALTSTHAGNSTSDGDPDVVVDGVIGLPEHPSSPFRVLYDALMVARETGTEVTDFGVHVDNVPVASSSRQTMSGDRDRTGVGNDGTDVGNDRSSVGNDRTSVGNDRTSVGNDKTSVGNDRTSVGNGRTSVGSDTSVGNDRTSVGNDRTSVGNDRTSVGNDRTSVGNDRTSVGNYRTSVGNDRTSMGNDRTSVGNDRTSVGNVASTDMRTNCNAEGGVRVGCEGGVRVGSEGGMRVGSESGGRTEQEPVASTSSEQGADGTWQHFKRFKKSVEKARRNYRKRKHPEDT